MTNGYQEIINELLDGEFNNLRELLMKKSNDYGFIGKPKLCQNVSILDGILVRMSDKIRRLENLRKVDIQKVQESFSDTLQDLAGYILLYLAYDKFIIGKQEVKNES